MSNERYTFANQQFLSGQIDWINNTFKVLLVNTANYTFLKDVHHSLSDVPLSARIATSGALTGKTASNGVARAADPTINTVSGPVINAIIIFKDTGNDSTSTLVCYIDTGAGLPWNPQGANVVIHWDTGPNGIFKL
jgi:uncharacterized protein YaaW (UPF0174 family)